MFNVLKFATLPAPWATTPGGPPAQFAFVGHAPPAGFVQVPLAATPAGASTTVTVAVVTTEPLWAVTT